MKFNKSTVYAGLGLLGVMIAGRPAALALGKNKNKQVSAWNKEIVGGTAVVLGLVAQTEPKLRSAGNGAMVAGIAIIGGSVLNRTGILPPGSALSPAANQQLTLGGSNSGAISNPGLDSTLAGDAAWEASNTGVA